MASKSSASSASSSIFAEDVAADPLVARNVHLCAAQAGKGRSVAASRRFEAGEVIVEELPCCALQSLGSSTNAQGLVLACGHTNCLAPLPAIGTQLGMLAKSVTRADLVASCAKSFAGAATPPATVTIGRIGKQLTDPATGEGGSGLPVAATAAVAPNEAEGSGQNCCSGGAVGVGEEVEEGAAPIFGCPGHCGVFFCSEECRSCALSAGHSLLCLGFVAMRLQQAIDASLTNTVALDGAAAQDLEAQLASHPLMLLKEYAIATNEVFLMAAQVAAAAVCRFLTGKKSNNSDQDEDDDDDDDDDACPAGDEHIARCALGPTSDFHADDMWWNVAPLPNRLWRAGLEDRLQKIALYRASLRIEAEEAVHLIEAAVCAQVSGADFSVAARQKAWVALGLGLPWLGRFVAAVQQNQIGFKLSHPAQALVKSLNVSQDEALDIRKAVEGYSGARDEEVPLPAPARRALDVTKALLPWIESIEWEAAGCGDSDCDEDGDEEGEQEDDDGELGEQRGSEYDEEAGSVDGSNAGVAAEEEETEEEAAEEEEDFISDHEAAAALVRLVSSIAPTDEGGGGGGGGEVGGGVSVDDSEQAARSGFCFVDQLFPAVDGAGMYPLICRMNHSCAPNVKVLFAPSRRRKEVPPASPRPAKACVVALRAIEAGEELCFSYVDPSLPATSRQQLLRDRYGFKCACSRCRGSDAESNILGSDSKGESIIRRNIETIVSTITAPSTVATSLDQARELLAHAGVVEIPAVVPAELVERCCLALTTRFEELLDALYARGLVESSLIAAGPAAARQNSQPVNTTAEPAEFFRFNEICQRSERRYDLRVDSSAPPFVELLQCLQRHDDSSQGCVLGRLAKSVLGRNYKVLYVGVVWSQPGSEGQDWHTDGPHLFSGNSHSLSYGMHDTGTNTEGDDEEEDDEGSDEEDAVPMFAPAHALNIFVPLVDLKPELGCTQFLRGSHVLATAGVTYGGDPTTSVARTRFDVTGTAPCAKAGSVIVFDSRVVHRGTPNTALSQGNPETPTLPPPSRLDGQRPLLYLTFSKPWFTDSVNFPSASVFDVAK